ncbi:MAG TPA: DUF1285 domain-containing protein [Desulfobacteraceae bacterium]|nr:MAG: hypothetical protein DRG82_08830 [Deltaproteobacteria bacterium]HDZ24632.1 DUF1285 domain-containing protein [Desulfobacteraceae bacterium]
MEQTRNKQDIPPCEISIDKEGRWFHKGAEIVRRDLIQLFYAHMKRDRQGRYLLYWQEKPCFVEVEDTAFVVKGIDEKDGAFFLHLSDDSTEGLAPETLSVGPDNVPYCRVKNGQFPARFTRAAYYQLAGHIEEEEGRGFFLRMGSKKYLIPLLCKKNRS